MEPDFLPLRTERKQLDFKSAQHLSKLVSSCTSGDMTYGVHEFVLTFVSYFLGDVVNSVGVDELMCGH